MAAASVVDRAAAKAKAVAADVAVRVVAKAKAVAADVAVRVVARAKAVAAGVKVDRADLLPFTEPMSPRMPMTSSWEWSMQTAASSMSFATLTAKVRSNSVEKVARLSENSLNKPLQRMFRSRLRLTSSGHPLSTPTK